MRIIVNIDVPELAPAIKFYCDALGLRLNRIIEGDTAELAGSSTVIYLLAQAARSGKQARQYTRHWTAVHIDFVVDDIAASAVKAVNAGAIQESACIEWRGSKCITFSDPFGHGFCLIEFENETYNEDSA